MRLFNPVILFFREIATRSNSNLFAYLILFFYLFFREIGQAFNLLGKDPDCRVIILSGNGKAFCAGIDLNDLIALGSVVNDDELDTARKSIKLLTVIKKFQNHHMEIEKVYVVQSEDRISKKCSSTYLGSCL